MAKFNCFSGLVGKNKKSKKETYKAKRGNATLQVKLEQPIVTCEKERLNSQSFDLLVPFGIQSGSTCEVKVVSKENSAKPEAVEAAYEGGDEHDDSLSMKRDLSDIDLQAKVAYSGDDTDLSINNIKNSSHSSITEMHHKLERNESGIEFIQSGHVSDPGIRKTAFWGSPKLKRSCSNLETGALIKKIANQLPRSKSNSFGDLRNLGDVEKEAVVHRNRSSPLSVITSCSADRVMLKRRSSSQVLPSRSKKLWWKLFLWSHRNLHKPAIPRTKVSSFQDSFNQKDGYTSENLEPSQARAKNKSKAEEPLMLQSPGSHSFDSGNNGANKFNNKNWETFHGGDNGFWHQSHWVAFSTESSSPLSRVDEWVRSLETQSPGQGVNGEDGDDKIRENFDYPPSPEDGRSPRKFTYTPLQSNGNVPEEVLQANNVIQSLNSFSTVAHIASMGLKVIPNISPFSSLRSVNLSGNFIVHITPGSLPKGLHTLNLSRNKITIIEGLRELTRLRVLDLSYNRISRIGHGLSNCTVIKELYLAGNKISDIEGLHRLLKLTVLDLSFNKITTTTALGQLIANYNSLLALNLVGNPIQSNLGEDQLRKMVSSLLPQLAYLNKQPLKPQRAREVVTNSVAKAALGNNSWNSRRKVSRRVSHGSSSRSRIGEGSSHRSQYKSRNNHLSSPSARK